MSLSDFTSLAPNDEQKMVVFEQTTRENAKKANTTGLIAGAIFGVLIVGIAFAFHKPKAPHGSGGGDGHSLGAEHAPASKKAAPKAAVAAPAEAVAEPAAEAAAEAVKAAPTPPAGATKAPPTALVGQ